MHHRLPSSLEALFREYGGYLYRYCLRLCHNPVDAEDLTQDVFLLAGQALRQFEGRASVASWLCRIADHRWQRVNANPLPTVPFGDALEGSVRTADPVWEGVEWELLLDAVEALPDPCRQAFVLVRVVGLKYREVSTLLNIPVPTVQSRVTSATERLKSVLAEEPAPRIPGGSRFTPLPSAPKRQKAA